MNELDDLEEINIWADRIPRRRTPKRSMQALRKMMRNGKRRQINSLAQKSIKNRKITLAQRIAIKTDPRTTETIAVEYGISDDYVRDIRQGKFG